MKIASIKIGERFRKDLGDIDNLSQSIKEIGLMHPIVIDKDSNLIAGLRRLEAYKRLGWEDIPVTIVDMEDVLKGQADENIVRKNFLPSEAVAIWDAMEEEKRGRKSLICSDSERISKQEPKQPRSDSEQGRRIERAAKALGFSTDSLSKAKQVVDSEDKELVKEMDRTGNISKAYRKLKQKREKETPIEVKSYDLRRGNFKKVLTDLKDIDAIITDPPYAGEYLYCFSELAEFASQKLKDDGFVAVYSGQYYLPEVIRRLSEHLTYVWTFCLYHIGQKQLVNNVNIMCGWKPVLIFSKGKKKMRFSAYDVLVSEKREKDNHKWQQSASGVKLLIEILTEPEELVVDPFAGSGTFLKVASEMGRQAIGAEIND